jgi:prophage regulatory protein
MRYLRIAEVEQLVGLSKSTIYAMIAEGQFPPQVHIGKRAVRWLSLDIEAWIADRRQSRSGGTPL